jgi:hypothetical protein
VIVSIEDRIPEVIAGEQFVFHFCQKQRSVYYLYTIVRQKFTIRDLIHEMILSEDDMGGIGYGDNLGPYGIDVTGGNYGALYNVFLKPFTDVVQTAVGKGKEVSTQAQTLAHVAGKTILTSLVPVIGENYKEIWKKNDEQIDKLRAQYKDIYDATFTAFKDNDILSAAFGYAPELMMTAATIRKAPEPALHLLNVLAGGKLDGWIEKVKKFMKFGDEKKPLDRDSGPGFAEGVIREDKDGKKKDIGQLLTQKKVKQAVASNPVVQRMKKDAQAAVREPLEQIYDVAKRVHSANSITALEGILKKKLGADKLNKLKGAEKTSIEKTLIDGAKKSTKDFFVKGINGLIKNAISAGVPENHPYIADHKNAVQKISVL